MPFSSLLTLCLHIATANGDIDVMGDTGGDWSAVSAALHSCNADITNYLDFQLVYPYLNQAGILPASSVHEFQHILQPDSNRARINNLLIRLRRCTEQEFKQFIAILRQTADEAGEAHEDLAKSLEENYERFQKEGCPDKGGKE